jgi:outer membrane protein TolC
VGIEPADETTWSVGVQASLPLFEGEQFAEAAQAREERRRLEEERLAARQRIEGRVRAASHRAGASYAGIRETRAAAEAARSNLDLVADAYSRGALPLIDVLDAQNAFVVAGEAADDALFDFLTDVIDIERALGRFAFQMTSEEKQAFQERLAAFLAAAERPEEEEE